MPSLHPLKPVRASNMIGFSAIKLLEMSHSDGTPSRRICSSSRQPMCRRRPFGGFSPGLVRSRTNPLARHTPLVELSSVDASTMANAPWATAVVSHTDVQSEVVGELTQQRVAHSNHNPLNSHNIQTPLRYSQFERELATHPNKAWVSGLLKSISNGVAIGYRGYRRSVAGRNLPSSSVHPAVINAELASEVSAGHLAGPFPPSAIPNVHCSGLGVVPKKGGKFRMIMHLSAPYGLSINDSIPKEDFSLRYPSIDDAVSLLHQAG